MRTPGLFAYVVALLASLLLGRVSAAAQQPQLTLQDVQTIFAQSVSRAVEISPNAVIAIVDRDGFVLGVWDVAGRLGSGNDPLVTGGFSVVGAAVREAGTASYLSSDQNAFTSRTAQFIIQQNFPPGILNQPPGPLVGVAFSNLPYSDVNRFRRIDAGPNGEKPGLPGCGFVANSLGTGIPNTRLSGRSSSAPLYKDKVLVGGIGVFSEMVDSFKLILTDELSNTVPGPNVDESVALAGQIGYAPRSDILATNVTINGIRVPYVLSAGKIKKLLPFADLPGRPVAGFSLHASPPLFPYPQMQLGGQSIEIRFPIKSDPIAGTINGQARLSAEEVTQIFARASARAKITRAGIRQPLGVPAEVWITVVGNPNQAGTPAPILGIGRTPGATFFSFDVALQKARTALFFSSATEALSTRTVGFLAQNFYPPGIEGRDPGPLGPEVFKLDPTGMPLANTIGLQVRYSVVKEDPNLPNGITVFPGGFPLYRNGVLIGAVGISGDGVDQDDIISASATGDEFAAPVGIRADQFTYDGARLPYAKFPRNPNL